MASPPLPAEDVEADIFKCPPLPVALVPALTSIVLSPAFTAAPTLARKLPDFPDRDLPDAMSIIPESAIA
jgi:hypothetical protein